jgi:hypothetical protein
MRTYEDILKDYCKWVVQKTGKEEYSYEEYLFKIGDENVAKATLFKQILELCYDKDNGFYYFLKFIVGDLLELGHPKPVRYNKLWRTWDRLVKKYNYLVIEAARGHGKSLFFELFNLYDLFLFPFRRIIIESASQEQATRILDELKLIVENNEWLASKKDITNWSDTQIGYNKGFILAKGFGSEILGNHVDRVIVDDILRSDNKLSDQQIEDFLDMNVQPTLTVRKGQLILVGTPKSESDIFSTIQSRIKEDSNTSWKMYKFPAIIDYDNKILQCPDRFSWDDLMQKRLSMGPLKFAREYQLEFFNRDSSLFPAIYIDRAKEKGSEMSLLDKDDKRGNQWSFIAGVDVARSGAVSADFSVMIIIAFNNVTNQKQVVHVWRKKGLKISEQAEQIASICKDFNHPFVLVEKNNMGQDMIEELADKWNVNVDAFTTGGQGQKKEELIRFLITAFEHEQIVLPMGDGVSREMTGIIEDELSKFCSSVSPAGNEVYEGKGAHDDCVMALAIANKATQSFGSPFAISDFSKGSDVYGMYTRRQGETELYQKIVMGILR